MRHWFPDLDARVLTPERMDDPALDAREHLRALAGLRRLNRVSRVAEALWRELRPRLRGPALRVLDVATGSGDVPLALQRLARARGARLEVGACDASPRAVAVARRQVARAGIALDVFRLDVLHEPVPHGRWDVVCCSLFLHHLRREDAVRVLAAMRAAAVRGVLVSDLCRTSSGYALALAASRVLTRSAVVHTDALLSVRAAFTPAELLEMASEAGLAGAKVRRVWPCRMLLGWWRS